MPSSTTYELLQAFLQMRDQVSTDLGISYLKHDSLEAYIAKTQRAATGHARGGETKEPRHRNLRSLLPTPVRKYEKAPEFGGFLVEGIYLACLAVGLA
jgi:hypothetical protein